MKVTYTEPIQRSYYTCDICGERVIQDGTCTLLYPDGNYSDPELQFHRKCLVTFLRKNLPNLKQL